MSHGIFDHLSAGVCETNQANKQRVQPGLYRLQSYAHETDINRNICGKNNNSTISNKHNDIGYRTDIESDLSVRVRLTGCDDDKHRPCKRNATDFHCNPGVPLNPVLCDRMITPTNMKMPSDRGF